MRERASCPAAVPSAVATLAVAAPDVLLRGWGACRFGTCWQPHPQTPAHHALLYSLTYVQFLWAEYSVRTTHDVPLL